MSVAEKLEKIARLVPGVAGYQDKEKSRVTDKTVRARLCERLADLKRAVEAEQRRLTEAKALDQLGSLGRLSAKLDKLTNEVRFASRGYRGFFDTYKLTQEKLERLYDFDLKLFDEVARLQGQVEILQSGRGDPAAFSAAVQALDGGLDAFEATLSGRSEILLAQ